MATYLNIAQALTAVLLTLTILFQIRGQGSGLFGSGESTFRVRRGLEKTLFQFTIVLALIFVIISIFSVRYPNS